MSRKSLVVLVADPDAATCQLIAEMLEASGHVVTSITGLVSGLRVLDTILFDALVVSIDPHHSAVDLDFLKVARISRPTMKIIGMSAEARVPDGTAHLMDAFLHKPFSIDHLNQAIHLVMRAPRQKTSRRQG